LIKGEIKAKVGQSGTLLRECRIKNDREKARRN
jgi:hypothetical protein